MRKATIIFLAFCVFKLISFTSRKNFDSRNKEYYEFIEKELSIKNTEHYHDLFYLRHLTDYNTEIPSFLKEKLEKYDVRYSEEALLHRIWFQDYAQALNLKDSPYDIHAYPLRLQNTVAEEIAKNKILIHYQNNNWAGAETDENQKVKGIINSIERIGDSLSIQINPFSYDTKQVWNNCHAGSKSVPVHSNPFYYKGLLSHFSCEIRNQITNEIDRVEFH